MQAIFISYQSSLTDKAALFIAIGIIWLSFGPLHRCPGDFALVWPQPQVLGQADPGLRLRVLGWKKLNQSAVLKAVTNVGQIDVFSPAVQLSIAPGQFSVIENKCAFKALSWKDSVLWSEQRHISLKAVWTAHTIMIWQSAFEPWRGKRFNIKCVRSSNAPE